MYPLTSKAKNRYHRWWSRKRWFEWSGSDSFSGSLYLWRSVARGQTNRRSGSTPYRHPHLNSLGSSEETLGTCRYQDRSFVLPQQPPEVQGCQEGEVHRTNQVPRRSPGTHRGYGRRKVDPWGSRRECGRGTDLSSRVRTGSVRSVEDRRWRTRVPKSVGSDQESREGRRRDHRRRVQGSCKAVETWQDRRQRTEGPGPDATPGPFLPRKETQNFSARVSGRVTPAGVRPPHSWVVPGRTVVRRTSWVPQGVWRLEEMQFFVVSDRTSGPGGGPAGRSSGLEGALDGRGLRGGKWGGEQSSSPSCPQGRRESVSCVPRR